MDRLSTGVTLVMLTLFSVMVAVSFTYPADARFMPQVIGFPAIGLCLLQLALDLLGARKSRRFTAPRAGSGLAPKGVAMVEADELGPLTFAAEVRIWLYFLGFIGGVLLFGFILSAPVLVTLYLWREARVRLRNALAAAAVFTLAMHLMFHELLTFRLHEGFVTETILDAVGG